MPKDNEVCPEDQFGPIATASPFEEAHEAFLRHEAAARAAALGNKQGVNCFLQSWSEIDACSRRLRESGVTGNMACPPKNWDVCLAIGMVQGDVLDLGGGAEGSASLRGAVERCLQGEKWSVDLVDSAPIEGVRSMRSDLTRTSFRRGQFDTLLCLSVIEHGVDEAAFAREAARLLKPDGKLLITFDYWEPKIDTHDQIVGGHPWRIFCRREVEELIARLETNGLELTSPVDWTTNEAVIHRANFSPCDAAYTFGALEFRRRPCQTASITAVLNGFARPSNLDAQIDALDAQTVRPDEVLVWHNAPPEGIAANQAVAARSISAYSNRNFGVWARFAYALNARSEYVCVFDDDTIPGTHWFQSCLDTMATCEALMVASGVIHQWKRWDGMTKVGNSTLNPEPVRVDYGGHAWFFRREWLATFWRELPDPACTLAGEDMHFSFMLQKYLGIPTYVPPHPEGDRRVWGSLRPELGVDAVSIWETNAADAGGTPARDAMGACFERQRVAGWRLVSDE